jgi:hypothetical protein
VRFAKTATKKKRRRAKKWAKAPNTRVDFYQVVAQYSQYPERYAGRYRGTRARSELAAVPRGTPP